MNKLFIGSGKPPIHPYHLQFVDKTYILIDKYIKHPNVIKMDASKLKFSNNSCSDIYASHVLEHIYNIKQVLKEWWRVLSPSGRLRILVPDLIWACKYLIQLNEKGEVDPRCKPYYENCEDVLKVIFGSQLHKGEYHYTGFTKKILEKQLTENKFEIKEIKTQFKSHHMQSIYVEAISKKEKAHL
jgi:predicted SAM-dependent methyltransferase